MLESAHRLFAIENPLGQDRPEVPVVAPSRHRLTIGQEIRGEWARWYCSEALLGFVKRQPQPSVGSFKFSFRNLGENWTALVHEAKSFGGENWVDADIATTLQDARPDDLYSGVWINTGIPATSIREANTLQALRQLLQGVDASAFLATDGTSPVEGFQRAIAGVLIGDRLGDLHLFVVLSGNTAVRCSQIRSEDAPTHPRSPQSGELSGKSVGIIGLGSAGSKMAISLGRMGIRAFYLVDHDLLLPVNLQRHALDWECVTQHKVDAVAVALRHICPGIRADVSRLHIAGQESNAAVSGALKRLGDCDLVIDATANSRVFNLLAAVARAAGKPMVWMEVYGGGIGGLVARSRPGLDPSPQDMRLAYLQYCEEHPDVASRPVTADYAAENDEGVVLTASDADIAVVAHHAVRLAVDCFVSPECSKYPYSMYLMGLAKAWVFEAPFATIPISTASLPAARPQAINAAELGPDNAAFLLSLFEKSGR
jgi:molybdopterin/thiamine biosynthesis adenylyltransferase